MANYPMSTGRTNPLSGSSTLPRLLGYAGLIPFITFAIGCWYPLPYVTQPLEILIAYGAIILAFMGAIHWGVEMTSSKPPLSSAYWVSIIVALLAWVSLLLDPKSALMILLISFVLLLLFDYAVSETQHFPNWYIPMRIPLTLVVVACLIATLQSPLI